VKLGEKNVGIFDRIVRVVLGAVLLAAAITNYLSSAPVSFAAIFIGAMLISTALLGTCGIYSVIGLNTCKIKKRE